jgi:hypothetical protein
LLHTQEVGGSKPPAPTGNPTEVDDFARGIPRTGEKILSDTVSKIRRRLLVALIVVDLVAVGIVLALSSRTL